MSLHSKALLKVWHLRRGRASDMHLMSWDTKRRDYNSEEKASCSNLTSFPEADFLCLEKFEQSVIAFGITKFFVTDLLQQKVFCEILENKSYNINNF